MIKSVFNSKYDVFVGFCGFHMHSIDVNEWKALNVMVEERQTVYETPKTGQSERCSGIAVQLK